MKVAFLVLKTLTSIGALGPLLLLVLFPAHSQSWESNDAAFQKHLKALADSAETVPPELASDSLIRIAALDASSKDKRLLLERAFQLAESAKYAVNLVGTVEQAFDTDSDAGLIQAALSKGLDRLTLQCRVVQLMLSIDAKRARELLLDMRVPSFPRLTCKAALRPSPQALYQTLDRVIATGFSEEERRAGKPLQFAEDLLHRISSPTELLPALRMLDALNVPQEDFDRLMTAFESRLSQTTADEGTFGAVAQPAFFSEFRTAVDLCHARHTSVESLVAALRTYLDRNLHLGSCADRVLERKFLADQFEEVRKTKTPDLPQFEFPMQVPPGLDERAELVLWWTNPTDKPILLGLKGLRRAISESQISSQNPGMSATTGSQGPKSAWESKLEEFLWELDQWKGDHADSQFTYFFQYCFAYNALVDMSPPGSVVNGIAQTYVELLSKSPNEFTDAPEWALMANRLIHQRQTSLADRTAIVRVIRERGDNILDFLCEMDELSARAAIQRTN